jgi:DNA-binding NtrC family response regulator
MNKPRILIVEDDNDWQQIYISSLSKSAYEITGTRKINEALSLLENETFDVVITDLKMLGGSEEFSGFGVLEQAKAKNPEIQVIVITGFGSVDHAMRAMGNGAYDYIIKGPDLRNKIALTVKGALEVNSLKKELLRESQNDDVEPGANNIIGNSTSMQALFEQIAQAAENDINVLIQGEGGTGKRLIAQTIHLRSQRKNEPFLVVDCGRLSETVLEAELFGYEAGTIYSTTESRPGKFEQAQ